jgi:hypothetical protein
MLILIHVKNIENKANKLGIKTQLVLFWFFVRLFLGFIRCVDDPGSDINLESILNIRT